MMPHVKSAWADRSYGGQNHIRLRDVPSGYRSYVKFDVNGIDEPVTRATLRLYVVDPSRDGGFDDQLRRKVAFGGAVYHAVARGTAQAEAVSPVAGNGRCHIKLDPRSIEDRANRVR